MTRESRKVTAFPLEKLEERSLNAEKQKLVTHRVGREPCGPRAAGRVGSFQPGLCQLTSAAASLPRMPPAGPPTVRPAVGLLLKSSAVAKESEQTQRCRVFPELALEIKSLRQRVLF